MSTSCLFNINKKKQQQQKSTPSASNNSVLNLAQSINGMKDLLKIVLQKNACQLQQPRSLTERKDSRGIRRENLSVIDQQKRSEDGNVSLYAKDDNESDRSRDDTEKKAGPLHTPQIIKKEMMIQQATIKLSRWDTKIY